MYLVKVTLGSGATPIVIPQANAGPIPPATSFQSIIIGAAAHTVNVGDSKVTATAGGGVPIAVAGPALVISPAQGYTCVLSEWFLAGTAADVVPVIVIP
jgi:hypothetical protein